MKVTTRHALSKHGVPIALDAYGKALTPSQAIQLFRDERNLSKEEAAQIFGCEPRSIEAWETGWRTVPVRALNVLRDYLEDERTTVLSRRLPPLPTFSRAAVKEWFSMKNNLQ